MNDTVKKMIEVIGGNKVAAMVGGVYSYSEKTNEVTFKFKGSRIANIMTMKIENDLYNIKFLKFNNRSMQLKTIKEYNGIFVNQFKSLFEQTTKLYLSL